MTQQITINPTAHPDKKTERESTRMAFAEIQVCSNERTELGADRPDGNWAGIPSVDVPEWAKAEDVMGKMMNGLACQNGGMWYRAVHCAPPKADSVLAH